MSVEEHENWDEYIEDTGKALDMSLSKIIKNVKIENNELRMTFGDGQGIKLWDDGQLCCERRWMHTDDDLEYYAGSKLLGVEVAAGPTTEEDFEPTESQFLKVTTSAGVFTVVNYNEHNGYYGGFTLECDFLNP